MKKDSAEVATLPPPTPPAPTPPPGPVAVGDAVVYDKTHTGAVVFRVHQPGNRNSLVDLGYVEQGISRIARSVEHRAGPGGWRTPAEVEGDRILTPLEEVEAARGRGERVPTIGDWITTS